MSDNKEYVSQDLEAGSIHISEEVVASIAATAALDVEGVYGLGGSTGSELSKLTKKTSGKDVRVIISQDNEISIDCYVVVLYGCSVVDVAKAVQEAIISTVESTIGQKVHDVNVSVGGISLPRNAKK